MHWKVPFFLSYIGCDTIQTAYFFRNCSYAVTAVEWEGGGKGEAKFLPLLWFKSSRSGKRNSRILSSKVNLPSQSPMHFLTWTSVVARVPFLSAQRSPWGVSIIHVRFLDAYPQLQVVLHGPYVDHSPQVLVRSEKKTLSLIYTCCDGSRGANNLKEIFDPSETAK